MATLFRHLLFLACTLVLCEITIAQNGVVRVIELGTGIENEFRQVWRTPDNNYVAYHEGRYTGNSTIFKYDTAFQVIWQVSPGFGIKDIALTTDSGIIACGIKSSDGPVYSEDFWLLKINKNGNVEWQRTYGGTEQDNGEAVVQKSNGNYVVLGHTRSTDGDVLNKSDTGMDLWVLELDASGNIVDQTVLGGTQIDGSYGSIDATADGGLILVASTASNDGDISGNHGAEDVWVAKLDDVYSLQWQRCIGGTGNDFPYSVFVDPSGDYIIGGETLSNNGDLAGTGTFPDGFIIKLAPDGSTKWVRIVAESWIDRVYEAKPGAGNTIIVAGTSWPASVNTIPKPAVLDAMDAFVMRLSADGQVKWSRRVGGSSIDMGYAITESAHGTLVLAGSKYFEGHDGDFTGIVTHVGESRGFLLEMRDMSSIKGVVFRDDNNNRIKDAGESFHTTTPVAAIKGATEITSYPPGGQFNLPVDTGTYLVRLKYPGSIDTTQFGISPKRRIITVSAPGQSDSFPIRIAPIHLIQDLDITVRQLTNAFTEHSVKYRIKFRNLGGHEIVAAHIIVKPGENLLFQSASEPNIPLQDTLLWEFLNFPAYGQDSFDITFLTKPMPAVMPGSIIELTAIADPFFNDFDSTNNVAQIRSVVAGQNAAISNIHFSGNTPDSARAGRTMRYTIFSSFTSQLDSTKGSIRLQKDPNTSIVSAAPMPDSVNGDTLVWNFIHLPPHGVDTILVNLKINDDAAIGSYVTLAGEQRFFTADTALLKRTFLLTQQISGTYVQPDTVTNTLQPPHGVRWTRAFGGSGQEFAHSVVALQDSGYIIAGYSSSADQDIEGDGTSIDGLIARYDKDGHLIWRQSPGTSGHDMLLDVAMASDGNFYASGIAGSDSEASAWVIKFNIQGDTLWTKMYGGSNSDGALAVIATEDGGCMFTGLTNSDDGDVHHYIPPPTAPDIPEILWLVKIDANGSLQWDSCYAGATHSYYPADLARTTDNKIVIGGTAYGAPVFELSTNGLLLVLNPDGTKAREKIYGKEGLIFLINGLVVNPDNSFTFTGQITQESMLSFDTTYSGTHGDNDVWVAKTDIDGNIEWQKYFGGSKDEIGNGISLSSDGNYLIAGAAESNDGNVTGQRSTGEEGDAWLLKVDPSGNLLWQKTVGGTKNDQFNAVAELRDLTLMAIGYTSSGDGDIFNYHGGLTDILLAKVGMSNFITGEVFLDQNNNGLKDPGEPEYSNGIIYAVGNSQEYAGIPINGAYHISTDTGTYSINMVTADSNYYHILPDVEQVTFDQYSQTAVVQIRLVKKADINDLRLSIIPHNPARPGFSVTYTVKYENKGTAGSTNPGLRIKLGNLTTYQHSTLPPSSTIEDTLVWNLPNIGIMQSASFQLTLRVKAPPAVANGDTVTLGAIILPVVGDFTPADNFAISKQVAQGSYDPNDKQELHGGVISPDFIENNEYLSYVIRFQNTGTDTAFNVYVRDTLQSNLDWSTFEMIEASHSYELTIQNQNIIEWYFKNIYLPDSNVNEPASHGFIAFRIRPQAALKVGDTVKNTAAIYFDFNLPVQTNLAKATIANNLPLPSTILRLSAGWQEPDLALLKWIAVNESSVSHYAIERSHDGVRYSEIGTVNALNVSAPHTYQLVDHGPFSSINYYRLKIVDIDGRTEYSRVILLKKENLVTSSFRIFPVPARQAITMLVSGKLKGFGTLTVYDMNGRVVSTENFGHIDKQDYSVLVNVAKLKSGMYVLKFTVGDQVYYEKLIIE